MKVDMLTAAVAAYPDGPDLPADHPATRELREIGERLASTGGLEAMRDAIVAADPHRTGEVGRRVNRIWTGSWCCSATTPRIRSSCAKVPI